MYRFLLRVFPRSFRERFGDDMADVFADRLRRARQQGAGAVLALWCRTIADVTAHGLAERHRVRSRRSGGRLMRLFIDDLIAAMRGLRRRAGFTLTAALMLAVGLGFNTALFAVVQSVLLTPLPYRD